MVPLRCISYKCSVFGNFDRNSVLIGVPISPVKIELLLELTVGAPSPRGITTRKPWGTHRNTTGKPSGDLGKPYGNNRGIVGKADHN